MTSTDFDAYAFIGWVWTCTTHPLLPSEPCALAGQWLADLGDAEFGWRFDVACRRGWAQLPADARAWAEEHLLPLCSDFIRACLLGEMRSKDIDPGA